ncbi:MAG: glycerol-3-phosphate dehydrogenase, partial [Planctomycetaceae bacterium]
MPKIAILGSGGMGTAMALVFAEKPEHHVVLWSHSATRH